MLNFIGNVVGPPDQVSFGEISCAGVAGLVGSLEQFDPTDEVGFRDFAKSQIWKTILEGLQNLVWTAEDCAERGAPLKRRSTNWLRSCTVPLLNLKSRRNFK
jgi:hypothetical protein